MPTGVPTLPWNYSLSQWLSLLLNWSVKGSLTQARPVGGERQLGYLPIRGVFELSL